MWNRDNAPNIAERVTKKLITGVGNKKAKNTVARKYEQSIVSERYRSTRTTTSKKAWHCIGVPWLSPHGYMLMTIRLRHVRCEEVDDGKHRAKLRLAGCCMPCL